MSGAEADAESGAEARADPDNVRVVSSLLTPALMVYYLCCWPGDAKSGCLRGYDVSTSILMLRYEMFQIPAPRKIAAVQFQNMSLYLLLTESVTRRASELFTKRLATSAVSLHLPSTSGHKKETLSAHRSHEEIGRRKSHHEAVASEDASRYHSAPSVIDEVLHRRDWERSSRDLHIPLRSPGEASTSHSDTSTVPPHAEPESSSIDEHKTDEQIVRPCKKHYTNIKSSKRKEKEIEEDKDCDATELTNFYIGDNDAKISNSSSPARDITVIGHKVKEAKQSFNESIRSKERPRATLVPLEEHRANMFPFCLDDVIDRLESLDRSGATHHTIESRISLSKPPYPPPSVEAVGYEGGACYLAERGSLRPAGSGAGAGAGAGAGVVGMRARHASDGDILAPPVRPESGAFSESDLDLELESTEERPPPYEELHFASPEKKETAI